jgi:hypothetical protein
MGGGPPTFDSATFRTIAVLPKRRNRLFVCVLKSHTVPRAYGELTRRADEQWRSSPGGCAGPMGGDRRGLDERGVARR